MKDQNNETKFKINLLLSSYIDLVNQFDPDRNI